MKVLIADLKIDWANYAAAEYACERWHYSKCLPSSMQKRVAIGAWENEKFIGVIVFGHGANPNIGKPYNLTINECIELTRVALNRRHITPVSRVVSIALKMLVKSQPGLRLIVSYADQSQGHYGGIYQAGNWIYVGNMKGVPSLRYKGKIWHAKALRTSYPNLSHSSSSVEKIPSGNKHKYLMPLDDEIRARVAKLAKPYPKRPKQAMAPQGHSGGVEPTRTLQINEVSNG